MYMYLKSSNRLCKSRAYSNIFGTTLVPNGPTYMYMYIALTHEGNKLAHFNGSQCSNTRENCTVNCEALLLVPTASLVFNYEVSGISRDLAIGWLVPEGQ